MKISIVCFKENSNEIVAVNLLLVRGKNESNHSDEESKSFFSGDAVLNWLAFNQYFDKLSPTVYDYFH